MIFGTFQCCFIRNICVDLKFITYIRQSGATGQKLITLIMFSMNAMGSLAISKRCLAEPVWTVCQLK